MNVRRMSIATALITAVALAIGLGVPGCGGGGEGGGTATAGAATERPAQQRPKGQESKKKTPSGKQEAAPQTSPEPNPPRSGARVPGSKAVAPGVPVTKGGDNSVQTFGDEGQEGEAAQAAATLAAYLRARAAQQWPEACAQASRQLEEELAKLIQRAKVTKQGVEKPKGCAGTLALLEGNTPSSSLRQGEVGKVLSFRVRPDGYAYLIYEDRGGTIRFIAMAKNDGAWKVNVPEPTELPAGEAQGASQ